MNCTHRKYIVSTLLAVVPLVFLHAGEKTDAAAQSPWSGSLSTGWDSLYMFRGVNQLPGYRNYGSSIAWTDLSLSWSPTDNNSLTVASWQAFGIDQSDYKEIDGTLTYTRAIGDLSLSAGYALYTVLSAPGGLYSNELTASAAYKFSFGAVTITPAANYDFTLGPQPGNGGYIQEGAGYLELRVDGEIPLYREFLKASPWVAAGFSFGYNAVEISDQTQSFTGTDHIEAGLILPISLSSTISLSPYVAYSHAWVQLAGTHQDTFWGGVSVTFSF